jgi:hypothetical protein
MIEIVLSRKADEFVPKNRWIASLSNGETIFEDARKGMTPAWERLGNYCRYNKLAITKLRVQLGPLEVEMPPNQIGYVQKKKMMATGAWSKKQWVVGHVSEQGTALLHYIATDRSSVTKIETDPGEPWVIYDYRDED